MQDGALVTLIELNAEVAKEVVSAQETHEHRPEASAQLYVLAGNGRVEWRGGLVMAAEPGARVDRTFFAFLELESENLSPGFGEAGRISAAIGEGV